MELNEPGVTRRHACLLGAAVGAAALGIVPGCAREGLFDPSGGEGWGEGDCQNRVLVVRSSEGMRELPGSLPGELPGIGLYDKAFFKENDLVVGRTRVGGGARRKELVGAGVEGGVATMCVRAREAGSGPRTPPSHAVYAAPVAKLEGDYEGVRMAVAGAF